MRDVLRARAFQISGSAATADRRSDLIVTTPLGDRLVFEVRGAAIPTSAWIDKLPRRLPAGTSLIVVGDQLSAETRAALDKRHIGWLDRRGHFRLIAPRVYVDVDTEPVPRDQHRPPRKAIKGRAGLAAAAQLLMAVDAPVNASEIARAAGLNPSSITRALQTLVDEQLVERRSVGVYRPLTPELFWAVAEVWPREGSLLHVELERFAALVRPDRSGPALAGARGAAAWGAPLTMTADTPPRVYVPDDATLRMVRVWSRESGPAVEVAVDPIGLVTRTTYARAEVIPRAHQVFCALDLAATSRDREVLTSWKQPAEGVARVW